MQLAHFSFMHHDFGIISKNTWPNLRSQRFSPKFSSSGFLVLYFKFMSIKHFQLAFVNIWDTVSSCILILPMYVQLYIMSLLHAKFLVFGYQLFVYNMLRCALAYLFDWYLSWWCSLNFLNLVWYLSLIWKIVNYYFFKYFFCPIFLFSPSSIPILHL